MFIPPGSIKNYVKTLDLQKKWERNKNDPGSLLPGMTGAGQAKSGPVPQDSYTAQFIRQKLASGSKLSYSELEYLRKNDSALYDKALRLQKEREEYERALRCCRTREETRGLRMGKLASLAGEAKNGADSGDVQMRASAVGDAHRAFMAEERYRRLPEDQRELRERRAGGERPEGPVRAVGEAVIYRGLHLRARKKPK